MKRLLLVFTIFMFSCVSTKEIFTSIEYSDQDNYGYSKENPILIGHYNNWQRNAKLSYLLLSKLKYNGKPLNDCSCNR